LPRHQRLGVADSNDLSAWNPLDLGRVLVGDHATANKRRLDHAWLLPFLW
jgi:hypothetical protein